MHMHETRSVTNALAADTGMGAVTLKVADLDAMTRYYRDAVGLDVLEDVGGRVRLGRGAGDVVVLEHAPGLRHASPHDAGLYHTAIVFDTREALAAAVLHTARAHPGSYTGSADHLVSLAFYFDDPEGNGVELYWDRPRSRWRVHGAEIEMGVDPLDANAFLRAHLTERGAVDPRIGTAHVGHVHLQVGDLEAARAFYVDAIGFDLTARYGPQAAFASAGGYHHHIGMNTWRSAGAGRRSAGLGLGRLELVVPGADDLGALAERLGDHGVPVGDDGKALSFEDPWGTAIVAAARHPRRLVP